ncbi:MAG: 5-formyltetrahydrofolate cyclo-ligase [Dermatophilaceae bacterium]
MSQGGEPAVTQDKQILRRELRRRRRSLAPQRNRAADAHAIASAASALLDSLTLPHMSRGKRPTYGDQPCVAIYRSLPHEPPTEALAEMLHSRSVQVIVPETLPDLDLEWRELRVDGSEGPRLGREGIAAAQVILAPGLAVDHIGTRLGQGGGSYDRALARRRPGALIVAIVNDQEFDEPPLPHDSHDVRVDAVITPGGGFQRIPDPGSAL